MIEAFGLTSNPRKAHPPAVDDVTFEACAGRVTALLGKEGAGKTTTLRLMLELQQGRGLTYFRGRPLHRIAHPSREVGVLLGDVPGHPARSVRGHLRMLCAATGVPVRRADEVLEAVGLVSLREERLGTLSRGVDRRLGLACALLPDPHTLVLDEPAHGLSTREGRWLHRMLRAHAVQGGTVLFTTSDPKEAARAADRVVTLEAGRLVADQEATDFARTRLRPRVAVRSPHAARLAALLTKEARTTHRSVEVVSEGGNRLSVYGSTTAEVGETAFRHGILVHQLADEVGDMGAGAGAEPPTDVVPDAERRQRGAVEPAAGDGARTVDEAPTTERRDTPGADRRQDTGGSPVTPQPRTSAGPRPLSQSRTADEGPGRDQSSNGADSSATAERQPSASLRALADGPAATPGSPHAEPSGGARATETPTVVLSARSAGASATARPPSAATASSQSPAQAPATTPEPPTHATSPDPMSATVPAQPPSTADSAQISAAASAHPPADAASAHSSAAPAPAQPSAAASSAHPSGTAPSAQTSAIAASVETPTATPSARPQAAAAADQAQAPAVSPQAPPRLVPGDPATPAVSSPPPAPAVPGEAPTTPAASSPPPAPAAPGEAPTTQLSVNQSPLRPGQAPTAKLSARQPKSKRQSSEPPSAGDDTTSPPAGPARPAGAVALGDPSPLPPAISVRSAPSPLRPLRYELRRAAGIGAGFVTCGAVLAVSALIAVLLARLGHTPQARLFAAWPRELPLPPAALGAGLLGALAFGDEFRHPALAADRGTVPRRLGLLTAKLVVSGATAVLLSFLTLGCDAEMLYLVYGGELAKVPADWLPMTASWFGLIVGCAWAGVLAAGVFRSTTAGLAAVLAVPVLVVPVVHKALQGSGARVAAGLLMRMREMLLLQWPFGGERYLVAATRVLAQPVGGALALSLTVLLCAYLFTTLRTRLR
ncbi:ATP-binding cassette domain-containing protein [Streptomyces sp. NPDC056660]|uniref:ABC transporter ATP-binding protein n=1 Tax=Streptomyces sp. NPDC056660 TaxID=3345897 RepID=UPI0036C204D0